MKGNLRHDKTCLNCGHTVEERFCTHCGQENTEPRESLRHLVGHFLSDITHYDAKFLTSIRDLIIKPGFLTKEYINGRRAGYLNPIRMYVFISAVFFIVLFNGSEEAPPLPPEAHPAAVNAFSQRIADSLRLAAPQGDSAQRALFFSLAARLDTPQAGNDTQESLGFHLTNLVTDLDIVENKYQRIGQYDSAQERNPASTWKSDVFNKWVTHRMIRLRQEHPGKGPIVVRENIGQNIPKLMFVLLPLFALFVSWFYNRRQYLYTQHVIFSLHFHSYAFIVLLFTQLALLPDVGEHGALAIFGGTLLLLYTYLGLALAGMHGEAYWKAFLKALALGLMYLFILLLAALMVAVYDFMTA
jgi:hypothetical protein